MNIDTGEEKEGIWLYDYYISDIDSDPYVWAESADGTIEKRSVELGEYDEEMMQYEILSGITEDDYLAFPETRLFEGMRTTYNAEDIMMYSDDLGDMGDLGEDYGFEGEGEIAYDGVAVG